MRETGDFSCTLLVETSANRDATRDDGGTVDFRNTGLVSVPVLPENCSLSTCRARRMLTYILDILCSPSPRQYWPCLRPMLAPPATRVGRLWLKCVVLALLPKSTIVLSMAGPLRRYNCWILIEEIRNLMAEEQIVLLRNPVDPAFPLRATNCDVSWKGQSFSGKLHVDAHTVLAIQHEAHCA